MPTPAPSPAPTTTFDKVSNRHLLFIGVSTFVVFVIAVIIRLDMPSYQAARVGFKQTLVVMFAWLDFAGDLTWTHQRFHAYYRGDEPYGLIFGIVSVVFLALSFGITSYVLATRVVIKHQDKLVQSKVTGPTFTSLLLLACTDPDAISFFPWKEEAYSKDEAQKYSPLPNKDCVQASMWKILEDVPEFFIQVTFFSVGEYDNFTAANLAFTLIMLFYLVMGKLQRMYLVTEEKEDEPTGLEKVFQRTISSVGGFFGAEARADAQRKQNVRKYVAVLRDLEKELFEVFHIKTGNGKRIADFLEEAQEVVCVEQWDMLKNSREKVYALADAIGIDITAAPPQSLLQRTFSSRNPSLRGTSSRHLEMTPQDREVDQEEPTAQATERKYSDVVSDLKQVLRDQLDIDIQTSKSFEELLEEAQKHIGLDDWDQLPDVKARAIALAKRLGVQVLSEAQPNHASSDHQDIQVSTAQV